MDLVLSGGTHWSQTIDFIKEDDGWSQLVSLRGRERERGRGKEREREKRVNKNKQTAGVNNKQRLNIIYKQ